MRKSCKYIVDSREYKIYLKNEKFIWGYKKDIMKSNVVYYRIANDIKYIYYHNSTQHYPEHTHADNAILGYILNGKIRITCDKEEHIYNAGEYYYIPPDTMHTIEPVYDITYSMISVCISIDKMAYESDDAVICFKQLKQLILDAPENVFLIRDMARKIGISPYYMIRQFRTACGLTPHQFQIQAPDCQTRYFHQNRAPLKDALYNLLQNDDMQLPL